MKTPQYIFIHHTEVSYDKNPDQFNATNNYHKDKWGVESSLGFYGGYNYEVSKNGTIRQFRRDGEITVAQYQEGMNDGRALSICLDGNFDVELPTPEQVAAVAAWLKEKMAKYNISSDHIYPHRWVAQYKTCPGSLLPDDVYHYFCPDKPQAESWAEDDWQWVLENGVLTDKDPQGQMTREMFARALHNYHKKFYEKKS